MAETVSHAGPVEPTPGPWQVRERSRWVETEHGRGVAQLPDQSPQSLADGALIAAAPELLAALRMLLAISHEPNTTHAEPCREVARAAIAKAEGR